MFGDPVQHSEARDEVSSVEQRRVLSEQCVDVRPGTRCPLHQPGVFPGLQRNQWLMARTNTNLINVNTLMGTKCSNIVFLKGIQFCQQAIGSKSVLVITLHPKSGIGFIPCVSVHNTCRAVRLPLQHFFFILTLKNRSKICKVISDIMKCMWPRIALIYLLHFSRYTKYWDSTFSQINIQVIYFDRRNLTFSKTNHERNK